MISGTFPGSAATEAMIFRGDAGAFSFLGRRTEAVTFTDDYSESWCSVHWLLD